MKRFFIGVVAALLLTAPIFFASAWATPEFPPLTGRVVDGANILSPAAEAQLTQKLAALETATTAQVVVATFPSLQGYEIEDFGYQLGRRWAIGQKDKDNGVVFIVAPSERKVRIEVGYGLEPVLTDALSSTIIQGQVIPRFKAGDLEGGVVAGTDAIISQLQLPPEEAQAIAAKAAQTHKSVAKNGSPFTLLIPIIFMIIIFSVVSRLGRRGRRGGGGSGLGAAIPWIILDSIVRSSGRGGGGGGSGGFGGGGFGGGGGSFGGGGSSGSW